MARRTDPRVTLLRELLPELLRRATQNADVKGAIMHAAGRLARAIEEDRPRRITEDWLDGVIGLRCQDGSHPVHPGPRYRRKTRPQEEEATQVTEQHYEWRCPRCRAINNHHGDGECRNTAVGAASLCDGLVCECWEWDPDRELRAQLSDHGTSLANRCENAVCYHCGWNGELPKLPFDPTKLKGWAKKAYDAGWRPPDGWTQ